LKNIAEQILKRPKKIQLLTSGRCKNPIISLLIREYCTLRMVGQDWLDNHDFPLGYPRNLNTEKPKLFGIEAKF